MLLLSKTKEKNRVQARAKRISSWQSLPDFNFLRNSTRLFHKKKTVSVSRDRLSAKTRVRIMNWMCWQRQKQAHSFTSERTAPAEYLLYASAPPTSRERETISPLTTRSSKTPSFHSEPYNNPGSCKTITTLRPK